GPAPWATRARVRPRKEDEIPRSAEAVAIAFLSGNGERRRRAERFPKPSQALRHQQQARGRRPLCLALRQSRRPSLAVAECWLERPAVDSWGLPTERG